MCSSCYRKWLKETNPEYKANQKECTKKWSKQVDTDPNKAHLKEKRNQFRKNWRLQRHYGMSLEEFNQLNEQQDGLCPICKTRNAVVVDHDHTTNEVCGILCRTCNSALGLLYEDAEIIQRAADYVKQRKTSKRPNSDS